MLVEGRASHTPQPLTSPEAPNVCSLCAVPDPVVPLGFARCCRMHGQGGECYEKTRQ